MIQSVRQFITQHDLIPRGARVLAAVSGGSDSVALAHILRELDGKAELELVGVVHFNHQLRAAAEGDEAFVRRVADNLGVPFFADRGDVAARARQERRSLENAARAARYEWFERARTLAAADLIALGHTRDDQAETVLLRLTRGAGPRGLAGMHPRNGAIVRPLLTCRRDELRAWLAGRGLAFVDDETNVDVSIPRNRVRAELLPLLANRFNPSIVDVLADQADLAREAWTWMAVEAASLAQHTVHATDDGPVAVRALDIAGLAAAPIALQRVVIWTALRDVGGRAITFEHVECVRRMLGDAPPGNADFPGQRVERIGNALVLRGRPAGTAGRRAAAVANLFRYSLSIPGEVVVPDAGIVSVEPLAGAIVRRAADRSAAMVRADLCGGSLVVRNRRPGDRFRPSGVGGRKKLQDFFVDRKIARERRDAVPIVADENDRIMWVAGYEIDEAFRVTDRSQPVLLLKFKALGGSA
ncbi:MAG: tRNA lysidine(34) synthetase TilS [Acidobacteria bacterium]|nr:tRNA lysidine(34) synthetase TilS [Acidobacteriota bacterium]